MTAFVVNTSAELVTECFRNVTSAPCAQMDCAQMQGACAGFAMGCRDQFAM